MKMPMFLANVFLANITSKLGLLHTFDLPRLVLCHAWVRIHRRSYAMKASALCNLALLKCHPILRAFFLWL